VIAFCIPAGYTRGLLSWVTVSRSASRKNFKS